MNITHLLSGGIDSVTAMYDLQKQGNVLFCLLFDYRQRHAQELLWAKQHASKAGLPFRTVTLPELGGLTEQSWIVPNRNDVFLSVAVNIASSHGFEAVSIAVNQDDAEMFPDCRQGFFDAKNACVAAAGYNVKIITPYIGYTKRMIVERSRQLGVNISDTWSCYQPTATGPCGKCPACQKIKDATSDIQRGMWAGVERGICGQ